MLFVRDYLRDQIVRRDAAAPSEPLVSVILPTYSRLRCGLFERAFQSVLSQTFRDFELIVMDDGSSDGTADYITSCRAADPRIVHVRHERNSGLPGLRVNEGIVLARGRYVAFQFDDDFWRPECLDVLTDAAASRPDTVIVGTSIFHHDGHEQRAPFVEVNRTTLYESCRFGNNCALIPRGLFDQYGMYDCHINMRRACDWDLWLRLIESVPIHVVSEVVADIFTFQAGSMGATTPWDLGLFRYLNAIPRDHLLTPDRWTDYEVDALRYGGVSLRGEYRRQVYEEHILPYYLKFRHHFPCLDDMPMRAIEDSLKDVVIVAEDLGNRLQHCLSDYDQLSSRRGGYKAHRHHPAQITAEELGSGSDALLLVGPGPHDTALMVEQRPLAVLLDRHPVPAASADAGTPDYHATARILREADCLWLADAEWTPVAHAYNRRTAPLLLSVPAGWFPDRPSPRDPERQLTVAYPAGALLQRPGLGDALGRVARDLGDRLRLVPVDSDTAEDWPDALLGRLRRLCDLAPDILLDLDPDPIADAFLEAAVSGALPILRHGPRHAAKSSGDTCLKCGDAPDDWAGAVRHAASLVPAHFDEIRAQALRFARESGTAEARLPLYEAAWGATEFHHLTRNRRGPDGRPRVAFFLHSHHTGGAEIQLWRRFRILPAYGIEPIVVLPEGARYAEDIHPALEELARLGLSPSFARYRYFIEPTSTRRHDDPAEVDALVGFLRELGPALVHSTTYIPSLGRACRRLGIAHVASLYHIEGNVAPEADPAVRAEYQAHCELVQTDSLRYAREWGNLLAVETACVRNLASEMVFDLGRARLAAEEMGPGDEPGRSSRVAVVGALQPRKGQLGAVSAVGALSREGLPLHLDLYGYSQFYPEYIAECRARSVRDRTEDSVVFHGFVTDLTDPFRRADILLCSSTYESFPTTICEAMAAGVLVVATPVGGISELVIDGITGLLCQGTSDLDIAEGLRRAVSLSPERRRRILEQARRVALSEFHPRRGARDLFATYVRALRRHAATTVVAAPSIPSAEAPASAPTPIPTPAPARWQGRSRGTSSSLRQLARRADRAAQRLLGIDRAEGSGRS
jgi:glycosyltransferase involved in cell wall biosynthesis